jgi:hypothetical protein
LPSISFLVEPEPSPETTVPIYSQLSVYGLSHVMFEEEYKVPLLSRARPQMGGHTAVIFTNEKLLSVSLAGLRLQCLCER